ncbi:MAG: hypothetical protein FD130_576, partial [Halothiobacillaceae bacterium]
MHVEDGWDTTVGVAKLFWGVTESRHLVDIINQTDLLEEIDQEQKLGQPMINLNLTRDYGTFSLFVLPYFREQRYENRQGRLRFALPIDTDQAHYDSARGARHTDVAVRWYHNQGNWDIGLAHFRGTSREAAFDFDLNNPAEPTLVPRYDMINQTGLEIQYTADAWLLKLETITRAGHGDRFTAVTTGVEYTLFDIMKSGADLGLISEYNYDGRDVNPTVAPPVPYDSDLFFALRLSMNDTHSSSVLAGILQDMAGGATFVNVEASRRFAQDWTVELQGRFFMDAAPDDFVFYGYHQDSYAQLRL